MRTEAEQIVEKLLPLLGGKQNIISAVHCTSRLRLQLRDEQKADTSAVENLDHVEGVFSRTGQYQIIFGVGMVNRVYKKLEEAIADSDASSAKSSVSGPTPSAIKRTKRHLLISFTTTLSNIFVPILPFIVAGGLLIGLAGTIQSAHWAAPDSAWMNMLNFFSSSALLFWPIIVGFSAAREFGGTPELGAFIGGIVAHFDITDIFGLPTGSIGYQGTVIPVLMSVYLMSKVQIGLRKAVNPSMALFVIPIITVLFTGIVSLLMIAPLGAFIGGLLTRGLESVYVHGGLIGGFLFGGVYSLIVITGLHHSLHAVEAGLISDPHIGVNFLLPVWSMANVAQGGAGLAVYLKTRNKKLKDTALPASISSFAGITEPVIFGINLRLRKPFVGACIGGAAGGAYVVFTQVAANSYGLTGLPMIVLAAPLGWSNLLNYLIGFVLAVGCAFAATWFLGFDECKGARDV
ncbi:PTS transporter subunit EIIC [Paenibacillus elgii]|uniref:PTS transporter subunit EIIC n=1 Tax=Paenibacillus elgii TaxID=189691 RepID=UPI000248DAC4|nr:PTS transporter subunit EIIC [Paenibacillus elgii]